MIDNGKVETNMNEKENWNNPSGYRTGLDRITISISVEMVRSWHLERAPEIEKAGSVRI